MKYIKIYEYFDKPNIGDYVIMKTLNKNIEYSNFLKTHPGEVMGYDDNIIRVRYTWNDDFNVDIPYKWRMKFFEINNKDKTHPDFPFLTHSFNKNKILVFNKDKDFLIKI
jgi:hypothetical protein